MKRVWKLTAKLGSCFWKLLDVIFSIELGSKLKLFGITFRSFWRLLGVIFAPLGPPGAPFGSKTLPGPSQDPSGEPLGASWSWFWAQPESTWSQLGPNLRQLEANLSPSPGNLEPTWAQVGPKLPPESHLEQSLGHLEASWGMWGKRFKILTKKWWNFTQKLNKIYPKNIKNTLL